jgi:hypothetical protein
MFLAITYRTMGSLKWRRFRQMTIAFTWCSCRTCTRFMSRVGMNELERYLAAGRETGCPEEQMTNFVRAGVVLQPRQLAASAAARLCDQAGGPTAVGYGGARGGGKGWRGPCLPRCLVAARARAAEKKGTRRRVGESAGSGQATSCKALEYCPAWDGCARRRWLLLCPTKTYVEGRPSRLLVCGEDGSTFGLFVACAQAAGIIGFESIAVYIHLWDFALGPVIVNFSQEGF